VPATMQHRLTTENIQVSSKESFMEIFFVLLAAFFAGIASLQMELSLLRETTFVLGSTAFTNSFIISIFLGGLALGAYSGTYLVKVIGGRVRALFMISQMVNIAAMVLFVFTKSEFLYGRHEEWEVLTYFGSLTTIPAFIAGMSFSLFLNMLYGKGEKYIAMVYAVSTVGNVVSGFAHGMLLVPHYGMRSTYIVGVIGAGVSIALVLGWRRPWKCLATLILTTAGLVAIYWAPPASTSSRNAVLWSKDDIHGLVQVIDKSEDWTSYDGGVAFDVRINNRHQCANSKWAVNWEFASVTQGMEILDDKATSVLNAGYCSGASVAKLLEYPSIEEVISIDMNETVIEAAELYFPQFHDKNMADERSSIIITEFRSYLKGLPQDKKFDMVLIDIAVKDPYYHGIFTLEFFNEIKAHLSDRGVVFWHKPRFLRTGAEAFPYVYRARSISHRFWYFTNFELPRKYSKDFMRVYPEQKSEIVYTDHKVFHLEAGERLPI
jgi:spermidine synthase